MLLLSLQHKTTISVLKNSKIVLLFRLVTGIILMKNVWIKESAYFKIL